VNLDAISRYSIILSETYEGREHFATDVEFNPIDEGTTFAIASLDCTIKFWG
jgi:hypothetical protein